LAAQHRDLIRFVVDEESGYIRSCGIDFDDEPVCLHLARAAALAWTRRPTMGRP
jgi:hypothetical protein